MTCRSAVFLFVFALIAAPALSTAESDFSAVCDGKGAQVMLSTDISRTVSGTPIGFRATIVNTNEQPITGGALFVRVYRVPAAGAPPTRLVADSFIAASGISLGRGTTTREFVWHVPLGAEIGTYRVAAELVSSQRTTAAVPSLPERGSPGTVDITIEHGSKGFVAFDRGGIKVAGAPHTIRTPIAIAGGGNVRVDARVINLKETGAEGVVHWRLYAWDLTPSLLPITEGTSSVRAHPKIPTATFFVIDDDTSPRYFLEGKLDAGKTTDVIGIRIARAGSSGAHLSGVAALSYPLATSTSIVACVRDVVEGETGRIDVSVTKPGSLGSVVAAGRYEGPLASALAIPLAGAGGEELKDFDVVARLHMNGKVVNTSIARYSCRDLGLSDCPLSAFENFVVRPQVTAAWTIFLILLGIVAVSVLLGARRLVLKR